MMIMMNKKKDQEQDTASHVAGITMMPGMAKAAQEQKADEK
jgi:hypothetical protein